MSMQQLEICLAVMRETQATHVISLSKKFKNTEYFNEIAYSR